ncbi:MAG: trypsin-like peptidase domain-containing protein [Bacteroidetes bacterium]|nr:trypsin-like peptidase domain-containing protein [Bacteroidota bacterium]
MVTMIVAIIGGYVFAGSYAIFSHESKSQNNIPQTEKVAVMPAGFNETTTPPADFEKAATSAVPSVVHIKTLTKAKDQKGRGMQGNPFGDLFGNDDIFKRFFGENGGGMQQDQRAAGSGVIISSEGYIVTNNHVVDGASDIMVTLSDRKNYKAKVIGADANTDLALIKIDAKNLPVMPIGNSDGVHLGQWVLAIGYPLNLDVTVTQGIVSAKSRNIGINNKSAAPVEAFIQTDAAVNPGSSGGALVNTNGELVGINAAIASPTGSYAGYAYAIPSNLMKKVIGDLMKFGTVQRGYLGISMAPDELDDASKKELGVNDQVSGVWVMETDPAGAAAEAGIKKGDAIIKINGTKVSSNAEVSEQVAQFKPGDKVSITFVRGNEEKTVDVVLKSKLGQFASQNAASAAALGAEFATLSKTECEQAGITGGVRVSAISEEGILGNETTMKEGFIITRIGDIPVSTVEQLQDAISKQAGNFQIQGVYPGSAKLYYYGINDLK